MWNLEPTARFNSRSKKYAKKRRKAWLAVSGNLNKLTSALAAGSSISGIRCGYFRSEGRGIWRIGQEGTPDVAPTRIYLYPDESKSTLHLLTMGDKNTQREDIQYCYEWLDSHKKQKSQ